MYTSKSGAENGIASVKSNAPKDDRFEKRPTAGGQYMFNLRAANHQVIGTSETYQTAAGRDNGIESVKTHAPIASTDDQT